MCDGVAVQEMGLVLAGLSGLKVWLTSVDPADDAVRAKLRLRPQPAFDRSRHPHVIEHDYFCNICEEIV